MIAHADVSDLRYLKASMEGIAMDDADMLPYMYTTYCNSQMSQLHNRGSLSRRVNF